MTADEILRELVAIPTPSSVTNLPLLGWVAGFLEPYGWRVELLPYTDEGGLAKANLLARPVLAEADSRIELAFVCHSDTVPYAAHWQGALHLEERNGHLHGCGSCDVKGALACFLAAVSSVPQGDVDSGVALIVTADEETGCKGMERLLAAKQMNIGSAIISEPTSLRAGIAGKGYGLARVTVHGREAHSAFPGQGVSAIAVAAQLIVRIEDRFAGGWSPESVGSALFDPPRTTVNMGLIEGGTAKNIVPGRCSFLVEWRSRPDEDPEAVLTEVRSLCDEVQKWEMRANIAVDGLRAERGFAPGNSGLLKQRLAALLPGEPVGISFGSEATRVARIADEVIVIGPGDMRTAHSDRECVPIAELEEWTSALTTLLLSGIQTGQSVPAEELRDGRVEGSASA